jgi:hypothetical protein
MLATPMKEGWMMSEIADRLEVAELFARLARVLDEGTPEDLRQVYTKDVVVRSPRGGEIHGIDNVVAYVLQSTDDELAQHVHGDVLVSVDGDRADASANQLVTFFRQGQAPHKRVGLRLKYKATRTAEGWLFQEGNINLVWQDED